MSEVPWTEVSTTIIGVYLLLDLVLKRLTPMLTRRGYINGLTTKEQYEVACKAVEPLVAAMDRGFEQQRRDNESIRGHLHRMSDIMQSVITSIAIINDRERRNP